MIHIRNASEIEKISTACKIVKETLEYVESLIVPGIATIELDTKAEKFIRSKGALPGFKGLYGFPATLCVSIDDEVVHGIPNNRELKEGEIISVDNKKNYNQIFNIIKEESHSRLPVYENNLDNIIGFFHVKDFIKINQNNFSLKNILRDVLYVAPKSPILELLKRMRTSRIHIALVVDGIGGVVGLVTIEDLVEEIVGEIEDEHDAEDVDEEIIRKDKNLLEVSASFRVDDLEKHFNINLDFADEDEVETVGGLVFSKINRIPKNNEEFNIDDIVNIKVLKANERKILTVQIRKIIN